MLKNPSERGETEFLKETLCSESRCYSVSKRRDWIQDRVCVAALKNLLDPVTGKRMRVSACLPTTTGPHSPQAHWWRGGGLMGPPAALQGGEALRHRNGASGEAEALFRCCCWPPSASYPGATFGLTSMPTAIVLPPPSLHLVFAPLRPALPPPRR